MRTIVSLITAKMKSPVAIIRISGDKAFDVINKISSRKITENDSWKVIKSRIIDSATIIDDVLITAFKAPNSFTGNDTIEINCHGNLLIIDKIIKLCLDNGCMLAERGEFSKQAFLNGKIDIIQATSINSLINSNSEIANKISLDSILGSNKTILEKIKDDLFDIIGNTEVSIDYPEYDDIKKFNENEIIETLSSINLVINKTINHFKKYKYIYDGINLLIIGMTNSGKSSLFNRFLNYDRSIVSNEKGTTRDYIKESIYINDLKFNIIDTAGFNNEAESIELEGIKKINELFNISDLVIYLFDTSKKINKKELEYFNNIKNNKILVKNKIDIDDFNKDINCPSISAKDGNISELIKNIEDKFKYKDESDIINISSFHEMDIFQEISSLINETIILIREDRISLDLALPYIENIYRKICIILGYENDFDILDDIFKKFCLGK